MDVLITGGANGIGKTTAERLVDRGHAVTVLDTDADGLDTLPAAVETRRVDVRDRDAVADAVDDAEPDVLVTCAAVQRRGALEDQDMDTIAAHIDTNLYGTLHAAKAALPHLRPGGRIVLVSSVAGRLVGPFWGAYCASKHAVEAVGDALRLELDDIDVTIVEPGPVRTGFNEQGRDHLETYLPGSRYADRYRAVLSSALGGVTPETAARTMVTAVEADRPRTRYTITWQAWLAPKLAAILPTRLMDYIARRSW